MRLALRASYKIVWLIARARPVGCNIWGEEVDSQKYCIFGFAPKIPNSDGTLQRNDPNKYECLLRLVSAISCAVASSAWVTGDGPLPILFYKAF